MSHNSACLRQRPVQVPVSEKDTPSASSCKHVRHTPFDPLRPTGRARLKSKSNKLKYRDQCRRIDLPMSTDGLFSDVPLLVL